MAKKDEIKVGGWIIGAINRKPVREIRSNPCDSVILSVPFDARSLYESGKRPRHPIIIIISKQKNIGEPIAPRTDPRNHNQWLKSNSALQRLFLSAEGRERREGMSSLK